MVLLRASDQVFLLTALLSIVLSIFIAVRDLRRKGLPLAASVEEYRLRSIVVVRLPDRSAPFFFGERVDGDPPTIVAANAVLVGVPGDGVVKRTLSQAE
jgi:hypothetical protein